GAIRLALTHQLRLELGTTGIVLQRTRARGLVRDRGDLRADHRPRESTPPVFGEAVEGNHVRTRPRLGQAEYQQVVVARVVGDPHLTAPEQVTRPAFRAKPRGAGAHRVALRHGSTTCGGR